MINPNASMMQRPLMQRAQTIATNANPQRQARFAANHPIAAQRVGIGQPQPNMVVPAQAQPGMGMQQQQMNVMGMPQQPQRNMMGNRPMPMQQQQFTPDQRGNLAGVAMDKLGGQNA